MMTCWPSLRSGHDSRFSASVFPVHVMQLPSMKPSFMRYCDSRRARERGGEVSGRSIDRSARFGVRETETTRARRERQDC
eukprot:31537-Pelagococcus_subviridis.AAC.3